ncbi:hypothetical protein Tcan_09646 [Toxocara canis]|uniref:Uncharacterized protein n=1 Tax=Toxocara canis TaxID=6265 RepID=A0A0B2V094_TOXCA|nr:hypothetical protein Tcan_09646 [Toxocara canis]
MSSTPVRQPEVNAVGVVGPPCSSAAELPSPQYDRNSSGSHFPLLRNASRAASIVEHRSVEREEDAVASA